MKDCEIAGILITALGGADNIRHITSCMTRLHVVVRDEARVQEDQLRTTEKVIGLVHDRVNCYEIVVGPGNSQKLADIFHEKGIAAVESAEADAGQHKGRKLKDLRERSFRDSLKFCGDIFIPLIPGVITAGLCMGAASLIAQLVPGYQDIRALYLVWQMLSLISTSFMTYITAWCGYRAAEAYQATPILGGMLGMITSLQGINEVARILGLYNESAPLSSILQAGKGGILAVICGVYIMARVEKAIRKRMPANLDVILTPLLTMLLCVVPYILIIMPLFGYISTGIAWVISHACMTDNLFVRIIVGYVCAAILLPLVALGMHHGLVALYAVQLQEFGYIMLLPALALAGAGQVGAAISLYVKAKRLGHKRLCSVIGGALPSALVGIGEPLIYGVTLPMGRPFLAACLGAGFGGAFVMFFQVAATTWGVSGLLGVFVMTAGKGGPVRSIIMYLIGYVISCSMGYVIAHIGVKDSEIVQALGGIAPGDSDKLGGFRKNEDSHKDEARKQDDFHRDEDSCKEDGSYKQDGSRKDDDSRRDEFSHKMVKHGEKIRFEQITTRINTRGENISNRNSGHSGHTCHPGHSSHSDLDSTYDFEYILQAPNGIHARPAGELAKIASGFDAQVTARIGDSTASMKSIIEMMQLGAVSGSKLTIHVSGKDAAAAAEAVQQYLSKNL